MQAPAKARALAEYLAAPTPALDWTHWHCGRFVGGWIHHTLGLDVLQGLLPCNTPAAWVRLIVRAGGWPALVTARLGCSPIPAACAQLGDIMLLPGAVTGGTLGICAGHTAVCTAELGGTAHLPMAEALRAWRLDEVKP